jgi:hypothetical protein
LKTNIQVSLKLCVLVLVCCRPIADFFAGKQQTADLFAEAVCRAGWRLNSAAGQAVVLSYVLSMCKSPDLGLQAYMWVSASILAQPDAPWMLCDKGTLDLATVAQRAVPALAQRLGDGAVAGSAPAFAEYIVWWVQH